MASRSRCVGTVVLLVLALLSVWIEAVPVAPPVVRAAPETVRAELPPLIPRRVLFSAPTRSTPRVSPDGQWLGYLAPDARGLTQIWVRSLDGTDDRQITDQTRRGIGSFSWAADGRRVIYLQDTDGDENYHIYAVDVATAAARDLTPFPGVRAYPIGVEGAIANRQLIAMNRRDPRLFDVYRLDLTTGELTLDTENPGDVEGWLVDRQQRVRAATTALPDGGGELLVRDAPGAPWRKVRTWGPEDTVYPAQFSPDGATLYLISNVGANAERLTALDLRGGRETVVAEDAQYDVSDLQVNPWTGRLEAVLFVRARQEWQVLEPALAADFETLARVRRGDFRIISRTRDDRLWVVQYRSDDAPVSWYLYRRSGKASGATLLFTARPALEQYTLARMEPIEYRSRDGLTIHGYLTLPVGVEPRGLPAVLLVHGGPQARDEWGYDPEVQLLANRGYAVLQVNFRGSTGYGKAFTEAGNGEWAGKMHDDLLDGVDWLIARGIADPKRIGIMGASYGGYATLVGLTFTPEVFAAGVDIVGPSNLITLWESIPPYWELGRAQLERMFGGSPQRNPEVLRAKSPLFFADRITRPLLVAQGANDPRVKQAESEQIVNAMRAAGKPVEYVLYTNEGHGFARPENRLHFYGLAENFLARHLGGRAEPVEEVPGHAGQLR